jgi:hypothetical protein
VKRTFILTPGCPAIGRLLRVREVFTKEQTVIFVPKEAEVFVGWDHKTMTEAGWPARLQEEVDAHFDTVFSLAHEKWKPTTTRDTSSPREWYLRQRPSWTVITNEGEEG